MKNGQDVNIQMRSSTSKLFMEISRRSSKDREKHDVSQQQFQRIWGPFHKSSYEWYLLYEFVEPVLNYRSNEFVALTNLCETGPWSPDKRQDVWIWQTTAKKLKAFNKCTRPLLEEKSSHFD